MNAFPLPTSPETMAPRQLMWGFAVAAAVVLSIWLLVAAGLARDGMSSEAAPGPLPEVPVMIQAGQPASGIKFAPAAGADIAPMEGSLSPR